MVWTRYQKIFGQVLLCDPIANTRQISCQNRIDFMWYRHITRVPFCDLKQCRLAVYYRYQQIFNHTFLLIHTLNQTYSNDIYSNVIYFQSVSSPSLTVTESKMSFNFLALEWKPDIRSFNYKLLNRISCFSVCRFFMFKFSRCCKNKMPAILALRVMLGLIHLFQLYASPIDKSILANGIVWVTTIALRCFPCVTLLRVSREIAGIPLR